MTVTEEQALGKFCPLAAIMNNDAVCVGECCMAWRWDQRSKHDGGYPGSPTPKEQWTGYCGIGGKP